MKHLNISRLVLFVLLTWCGLAVGQNITATLLGRVTDETGAVLPGVQITVKNLNTGLTRDTITNETGDYIVTFLPVGEYEVTTELTGFRRDVRHGIVLQVDQRARVDIRFQVGEVTETLEVTAAAPLIDTETSAIGTVIDNRKISELPLNARRFEELALLVPGAVAPAPGSSLGFRGGFNVSGAREEMNHFLLDGVDNMDQSTNNFVLRPSVDMIQEFKVRTNNYSAEFGRGGGAQVNVTTRPGTNEFHGTAWEFLRNEKLDARNFFDDPARPKPGFKRNQFGGTLGGPIQKDRTFFFGAYEGLRLRQAMTQLATVPPPAFRNGDFSALLQAGNPYTRDRRPLIIRDPITQQPFPNNVIPASRVDPIGRAIVNLYPLPNTADPIRSLLSSPRLRQRVDLYSGRIDHRFSEKTQFFGRYSIQNDVFYSPFGNFAGSNVPATAGTTILAHKTCPLCTHAFFLPKPSLKDASDSHEFVRPVGRRI